MKDWNEAYNAGINIREVADKAWKLNGAADKELSGGPHLVMRCNGRYCP